MKQIIETLHYCKADKHTGKPIIHTDSKGKRTNLSRWRKVLYDKEGNEVVLRMAFGNSSGKAARQGATTVLQILQG